MPCLTLGVNELRDRVKQGYKARIKSGALEDHGRKVSIGGRNITNLQFAYDIVALSATEQALEALVESLDKTSRRNKMEMSAEKTEPMTNSANDIQRGIKVKGLGTGTSVGSIDSEDGLRPQILSRTAQSTAALVPA